MPDLPAANWTCHTSSSTFHRTFTRTLGAAEAAFYWDGEFAGTSDIVERTTVAIAPSLVIESPTADAERFRGIWVLLKRRFPLLAVRVEELDDGRDLRFVVEESRAVSVQDDGVEFEFVADADENTVKRVLERALNAPERRISPRGAYAAISVLRRPDKDEQGDVVYDVVTHASHAIMDGMASCALVRTFCDTLARWPASLSDPLPDIEDRLRMVPAADSLYPRLPISPARRRWRRAIATVIQTRRSAARRGGHSLPGLRTATTSRTPAHSRTLRVQLSMAQTAALVASARAHHVSVAHMLPAIIYVALAEVLHRRRGRGGMDDEEWARRIRSVVHVGGPLNIRPFLDREWFENGGANEMNLSIGFWVGQLPHIPSTQRADGQPLITADRFWYLVSRAKDLMTKYYMHPLFFDMAQAARDVRITRGHRAAETWRKLKSGEDVPPAPVDPDAPIFTAIISSMGNMDALLPTEFQSADSGTTLQRTRSDPFLRCRPAELYFGSKTLEGIMELYVFYDENTYREDVVREWLDVVRQVVTRYSHGSIPTLV